MSTGPSAAFVEEALGAGGVNGGNPKGAVWFCGIEFGKTPSRTPSLDRDLPRRMHSDSPLPYWTEEYLDYLDEGRSPGRAASWPFMQKMARVSLSWAGDESPGLPLVRAYVREQLCRLDGDTFQLNLYPVAFNNTSDSEFDDRYRALTGFDSKTAYRLWCREHRFPRLRALVRDHAPAALICVGSTYEEDYRLAFLDPPQRWSSPSHSFVLPRAQRDVRVFRLEQEGTLVAITPFLGQGGIMANSDLAYLGLRLRQLTEGDG